MHAYLVILASPLYMPAWSTIYAYPYLVKVF